MIGFRGHTLSIILLGALSLASGFLPQCPSKLPLCSPTSIPFHTSVLALSTKSNVAEKDPVWIEKSSSMDETEEEDSNKEVDSYDVGISGEVFQTGKLGKRMFDAIVERMSMGMSDEIKKGFTLYAMDMTAKEATRAALQQNGLDMALEEEEEDQGMWGDVESVRLYDEKTGIAFSTLYDSLESALKDWSPGQPFDFVARKVPAKERELSVDELLEALDPDGKLREEAKGAKGEDFTPDEAALWEIFDGGLTSLADLADLNIRRTENSPRGATLEGEAFAGLDKRGYNVIRRSDLLLDSLNADGTENHKSEY